MAAVSLPSRRLRSAGAITSRETKDQNYGFGQLKTVVR